MGLDQYARVVKREYNNETLTDRDITIVTGKHTEIFHTHYSPLSIRSSTVYSHSIVLFASRLVSYILACSGLCTHSPSLPVFDAKGVVVIRAALFPLPKHNLS